MSSLSVKLNQGAFIGKTPASAVTHGSSSYGSTTGGGFHEPFSSPGQISEMGVSKHAVSSKESSAKPLCTINEQKEADEDHEGQIIEKLRRSLKDYKAEATISTKCKPGQEIQESQSTNRPPKWMNVDHGIKNRDRSVPDMVKKQYERMQQDQKEQMQVSKQFLEDKSGGESTVYCKRALPKN